jgi:hypothetical protein
VFRVRDVVATVAAGLAATVAGAEADEATGTALRAVAAAGTACAVVVAGRWAGTCVAGADTGCVAGFVTCDTGLLLGADGADRGALPPAGAIGVSLGARCGVAGSLGPTAASESGPSPEA